MIPNANDYFQENGYQCFSCAKVFNSFKGLKVHISKYQNCKGNVTNQSLIQAGSDFETQERVNASTHILQGYNTMDRLRGTQSIWMQNFLHRNNNANNKPKKAKLNYEASSSSNHVIPFPNSEVQDLNYSRDCNFQDVTETANLDEPYHVDEVSETGIEDEHCAIDDVVETIRKSNIRKSKRTIRKRVFFDESDDESECDDIFESSSSTDDDITRNMTHEPPIDNHNFQISKELIDMDKSIFKSLKTGIVDNKLIALSKLEKILRKCNAPLFLFHEIQEYINKYHHLFHDNENVMSRKHFYNKISHAIYGNECSKFKPITYIMKLPSEEIVDIVYYDFISQVYSILSDRMVSNYENTIFKYIDHPTNHSKDPFFTPYTWKATEGHYGDIETTVYYRILLIRKLSKLAEEQSISFEEAANRFILCPLLFFTDGTLITRSLSTGVEPLNFTLGILDQNTRNQHEAWRVLTVIPAVKSTLTPKEKLEDYHAIISFIFEAIMTKIENYAFTWTIFDKNGNPMPERNLILSPYCFAGDAAGHAKLCGKYNNFSRIKHISRDCNCLTEDADNVDVECKWLLHDQMTTMPEEDLKAISFYKIDNFAFKKNIFGYNPLGIWGSTPPEPLHLLFGGLVDYIYNAFHNKLYPQQAKFLDKCVMRIASFHCRHTCKDEFPRMSLFKNGLQLKGSIAAKDKVARIFMLFLVSTCDEWRKYIVGSKWKQFEGTDEEPDQDEGTVESSGKGKQKKFSAIIVTIEMYIEWAQLFEQTFILCKWVTYERKKRVDFIGRKESIAYKCIQRYLRSVANIVKRDKAGLKLLKFHHVLHLPSYMPFITMASVNTCIHENHHITMVKHTGRNTQQRSSTIRSQTMQRVYESDSLDRFTSLYCNDTPCVGTKRLSSNNHTFELRFNYDTNTIEYMWLDKRKSGDIEPPSELLKSVFDKFNSYNGGTPFARLYSIRGFTTLEPPNRKYNRPIRAVEEIYGDSWFDWVDIEWDKYGILPARIYMMLDFREPTVSGISFQNNVPGSSQIASEVKNDIQLLVHSAAKERQRSINSRYILKHAKLNLVRQFEMEKTLQWISFDNVLKPAFVYQDWDNNYMDREKKIPSFMQRPNNNDCFFIPHDVDWHEVFIKSLANDVGGTTYEEKRIQKEREFGNVSPNYNDFF